MAKASTSRGRKTRRGSAAKAKGGMAVWYATAALVMGGIVAYDHRDDLARYLPPEKRPAKTAAQPAAAKPMQRPPAANGPTTGRDTASAPARAIPVPPASIPSPTLTDSSRRGPSMPEPLAQGHAVPARAGTQTLPQQAAKPMLASLPPPTIAPTPGAKSLAADGGAKMVGAGFKGRFYYCGRSGLNDCIAESGVFWHDRTAVRLADVDVPSAESARCEAERQRGFRAKVRLRELLDAGPFDLVLSDNGDREQAGAKLRVAMRNGKSIGDQLVREGLAQPKGGTVSNWCS
ncbi:hypothetical protein ACQKKX_08850 [Neorhizobium sp. NPDC001467]|uniref:hypothetical protein n=1 Tax=Neorhizobium sp. NPDC001467 TaxID=3390595 RepID=UPI003CFC4641